jgi:anthranilate phosphoribosyltransferase
MEVLTMIKEAIIKIVNKGDLTYDEAHQVMMEIMKGETTPTQNAAFLAALSTKSTKAETIDEISGCAEAMRSLATPVPHPGMEVLEIVGTGGDGAHSFNISTTSAMVLAAGGVKVAKHGNRAASSLCGTADCLEALGINIQQDPQLALKMLEGNEFLLPLCPEIPRCHEIRRPYPQGTGLPDGLQHPRPSDQPGQAGNVPPRRL